MAAFSFISPYKHIGQPLKTFLRANTEADFLPGSSFWQGKGPAFWLRGLSARQKFICRPGSSFSGRAFSEGQKLFPAAVPFLYGVSKLFFGQLFGVLSEFVLTKSVNIFPGVLLHGRADGRFISWGRSLFSTIERQLPRLAVLPVYTAKA